MNDRFKFRIWDEKEKIFLDHPQINPLFGCVCGYENSAYPLQIEQCTGVKDTNDNLIYENDIVEQSPSGNKYKIIWIDTDCGWGLENAQTGFIRTMNCFDGDELEIISNIHEQKE